MRREKELGKEEGKETDDKEERETRRGWKGTDRRKSEEWEDRQVNRNRRRAQKRKGK